MKVQTSKVTAGAGSLALVGGVLALDFCNTSSGRGTDRHREHLRATSDLLTWARRAAIVNEPTEMTLRALFESDLALAVGVFERALGLREAIYQLTTALAQGRPVDQTSVDKVAGEHAACIAKGRLVTHQGAFGWAWTVKDAPEEVVLGPIIASAMAVITAADRARLKQCEGHHCGWLFLDTTKSNNRVWCEMEPCGNRAKQSRRRGRQRGDP